MPGGAYNGILLPERGGQGRRPLPPPSEYSFSIYQKSSVNGRGCRGSGSGAAALSPKDEAILKVAKEIVVKFIGGGPVVPHRLSGHLRHGHGYGAPRPGGISLAMRRRSGREPHELRPIVIQPNYLEFADGSALVTWGRTQVLCAASVLDQVPAFRLESGGGWGDREYGMLPRSTHTRQTGRAPAVASGAAARRFSADRRSLRAWWTWPLWGSAPSFWTAMSSRPTVAPAAPPSPGLRGPVPGPGALRGKRYWQLCR